MSMIHTLPLETQTVDLETGEVKTRVVNAMIAPAPPGTCPVCATSHPAELPHNAQSLFYQYSFYAEEKRWPSWDDAMAHCTDEMKNHWRSALESMGVDLERAGGAGKKESAQ
ncbi:MAG: hypothetical protein [Bacteriophage sp.]|nr:MAG: hypothetical protein [Bacteriophage sp.]